MPKSLLPFHPSGGQQPSRREFPEQLPSRAGAALQVDSFNLGVGRLLLYLGVLGTCIEVFTSTKAILLEFLSNPGTTDPGWWIKLGFSSFFALAVEAGMLTLVVNLRDSWLNIFTGHPERAFVSQGEVNIQMLLLLVFELGGAGINAWWNIIFFGSITTSPFLISTGCIVLLLCSLLMWPLGIKVVRNAKRRKRLAKRVAADTAARQERQAVRHASRVSPVVDADQRGLIPYQEGD